MKVHPRVCGGNELTAYLIQYLKGPSPRVRGKHRTPPSCCLWRGSIPACAGETSLAGILRQYGTVHPRVCGGNRPGLDIGDVGNGPSPRVRGKRQPVAAKTTNLRSIPACAGETSTCHQARSRISVHPRVCGGNTRRADLPWPPQGPSPRVRGKRGVISSSSPPLRSIPACAGETRSR